VKNLPAEAAAAGDSAGDTDAGGDMPTGDS
jgi:hypothetical protein